jgi:cystathionine beta-lyase
VSYDFDLEIHRRGTGCIKWDLVPEDVLPLFIADMDFYAAPVITEAVVRRAQEHPVYGYTRSDQEIFPAFQGWFQRTYGVTLPSEWLVLIPGVVPGLAVASNLKTGKSAAFTPNYSHLLSAPVVAGKELVTAPLRNQAEVYEMDFDAMEAALEPDTSLFYLCSPHNPVGRVWKREELEALSDFAQAHELTVVSDEIHCELVYDRPHTPFFTVSDYAREHSITLYAPGKTYNLAGNNLAIAVIPNEALRKEFRSAGYAFSSPGIFNTAAAAAAYEKAGDWRDALLDYLRENRDYLEGELRRRFPKAKFTHTEGTYLQWVDFRPYGEQFDADYFRHHAKVFLTSGTEFGAPGYVRINFGTQRSRLAKALDRLEQAILDGGNPHGEDL